MSAFVFAGGRCSKTSKACACCFRRNVAVVFAHGRFFIEIRGYAYVHTFGAPICIYEILL